MKLLRLYQPRNPIFWMMLTLNGLSAALVWIVQNRSLTTTAMLVIAVFALCNAILGSWFMWRLVKNTPAPPP